MKISRILSAIPIVILCLLPMHSNAFWCSTIEFIGSANPNPPCMYWDAPPGIDASFRMATSATLAGPLTMMNGAHGNPLSRQVAVGKNTFWASGDWGRDDHGNRNGNLGLAEFGFGRNFGPVQLNVSLGHTRISQNFTLNGGAKAEGTYLMAESLIPVSENGLTATLGVFGHWGEADIRRGYNNLVLGNQLSSGSSDTFSWGLRARMDWQNAWRIGQNGGLTPYVDFSYSRMRMDAFTETGGSNPLQLNARAEKGTEMRLGFNTRIPLNNSVRFLATLEGIHRFEKNGSRVSGRDVGMGLINFDVAGVQYQRNWARGVIGIESDVGGGRVSLLLNATSRGEMPSAWMAATYQVSF